MSVSFRPRRSADCFLTWAQFAIPPAVGPAGPPSSLPVATGRPAALSTYSRRNTWWEGCEVYVCDWSTYGESVLDASWTSSAVPRMPSSPGWFCARVRTMKRWLAGRSSPLPKTWSLPATSGSSLLSGTKTLAPLLTVWSTPWSKNWPNRVNIELSGGERPTSVVTLGMKSVWCEGTHPAGTPSTGGVASGSGSVVQGCTPTLPCVRTGNPAAATAAGLVEVWSTMRLLISRGWVSKTLPDFCLYDVEPGAPNPAGTSPASLNTGLV